MLVLDGVLVIAPSTLLREYETERPLVTVHLYQFILGTGNLTIYLSKPKLDVASAFDTVFVWV